MPLPAARPCAHAVLRSLAHPSHRARSTGAAAARLRDGANPSIKRCANVGVPRCLSTPSQTDGGANTSICNNRGSGVGARRCLSTPSQPDGGRAEELKKLGYRNAKPQASDDFVPLPLPFNKSSNAIFIDAQNAYEKDFPVIQRHIESNVLPSLTQPSVKKIYGDADLLANSSWAQSMEEHALESSEEYKNVNIDSLMVMGVTECLLKRPDIQTYILVTGDGDFAPLVRKLRDKGKTVIVYSSGRIMANKLREACHHYFDTRDLVMADPEAREREVARREKERRKREAKREAKAEENKRAVDEKEKAKEAEEEKEEPTLVGAVSDAFGSLFNDKASSPAVEAPPSTSPEKKTGWRADRKHEPWYITRKKKRVIRPRPDSFASAVKYHSGLIRNPKGLLKQAYRDVRGRSFRNSCFHLEELNAEDGETWYTATFTDPITKERFWSGLGAAVVEEDDLYTGPHINPPLHLTEVKVLDGRVYYPEKNHAKQAASARALDCYIFREGAGARFAFDDDGGDDEKVLRFALEAPYASFRAGVEQKIDYDALLSQRKTSAPSSSVDDEGEKAA